MDKKSKNPTSRILDCQVVAKRASTRESVCLKAERPVSRRNIVEAIKCVERNVDEKASCWDFRELRFDDKASDVGIDSNLTFSSEGTRVFKSIKKIALPKIELPKLSFPALSIKPVLKLTSPLAKLDLKPLFRNFAQILLILIFSLYSFTKNLVRNLSRSISAILVSSLIPLMYMGRAFVILLSRWLKISGLHGVPSISTRKLRALTLVGTFQLITILIVFRLFALQGAEHIKWEGIASKQQLRDINEKGARGTIFDRNGLELAVSIPSLSIGAHPKWIKNVDMAAAKLSPILGESEAEIKKRLQTDKQFIWLARGLSQTKEKEVANLRLFGLELEKEYQRAYPLGDLASTIIGKAGSEGDGLSGIERSYDRVLSGPSIVHSMSRDAKGRMINMQAWENKEGLALTHLKEFFNDDGLPQVDKSNKVEGNQVQLTLDSSIQNILEEEVDVSKESAKAKHVFGLMMDASSGEILAMAQSERSDLGGDKTASPEALRNIVLQNSFEPGSTFKPIVTAIALEKKVTNPSEMLNCENGKFPVGKYVIKDAHPVPTVSLMQVLVRSSNIGMAKLGFRLGRDTLYGELRKFGFGEPTKVGLQGEAGGIFRKGSSWANIDVATHSFGQGVSVTALQLVRAYAALANGGYLVRPRIISDKEVPLDSNPRILSKATSDFIREALNQVTENEHGTGKNSKINGVPVYGKTGTAQKSREGGVGYDPNKILASFIGFVDGKSVGVDRTLVLYIAVDEPGVWPRWGGTLAAPVFKKVMERTLSHYLLNEPNSGARLASSRRIPKDELL